MLRTPRLAVFVLFAGFTFLAAGCGSAESKLHGKWKVTGGTGMDAAAKLGGKDGKEDKSYLWMEFKPDNTVTMGFEMDPEMKKMIEKSGGKFEMPNSTAKYKVTGDELEIIPDDKDKKAAKDDKMPNKGKFTVEGDTLTVTAGSTTLKLTKMK